MYEPFKTGGLGATLGFRLAGLAGRLLGSEGGAGSNTFIIVKLALLFAFRCNVLTFCTGCRPGPLRLRWSELDFACNVLRFGCMPFKLFSLPY